MHETTLNEKYQTNIICKGWNNRFKHLLGHSHPTMWKLIDKMRQEISVDICKIELNEIGNKSKQNIMEDRFQDKHCAGDLSIMSNDEPVEHLFENISHCEKEIENNN